jgi:hypothetical protein
LIISAVALSPVTINKQAERRRVDEVYPGNAHVEGLSI